MKKGGRPRKSDVLRLLHRVNCALGVKLSDDAFSIFTTMGAHVCPRCIRVIQDLLRRNPKSRIEVAIRCVQIVRYADEAERRKYDMIFEVAVVDVHGFLASVYEYLEFLGGPYDRLNARAPGK